LTFLKGFNVLTAETDERSWWHSIMRSSICKNKAVLGLVSSVGMVCSAIAFAQTPLPCPAPDTFLPHGNVRNSEAGVVRIYKVGSDGKIGRQPAGYPKTVADPTKTFETADDEAPRIHEGIDYSSKGPDGRPIPLEFKAGVYGTLTVVRNGFISVQVDEAGNRVEYLPDDMQARPRQTLFFDENAPKPKPKQ
jgi:hypothetical protein